jgi:hypothetical protein
LIAFTVSTALRAAHSALAVGRFHEWDTHAEPIAFVSADEARRSDDMYRMQEAFGRDNVH